MGLLNLKTRVLLGVCLPLLLLLFLAISSYRATAQMQKANAWVEHTHNVLNEAKLIEGAAVDMETGMRGFLLAGDETFLDPYISGQLLFTEKVQELSNTVSDNTAQVELLGDIETTIGQWVQEVTTPMIELRRRIGDSATMDDMADLVGEARGKVYFDQFRAEIAEFIDRENTLIKQRESDADLAFKSDTPDVEVIHDAMEWVTHTHTVIRKAKEIEGAAIDMETGLRGYLLAGREEFLEPYNSGESKFETQVAELKLTVSDNPAQVELLDQISGTITLWKNEVTVPMIELRRSIGDSETMNDMAALVGEARGKKFFDQFRAQIAQFSQREKDLMESRKDDMAKAASSLKSTIITNTLIAFVLSISFACWMIRSLSRPIATMLDRFHLIAEGDLTQRVNSKSKDELGQLSNQFDRVVENMHGILSEVAVVCEEVATGSTLVATSSDEMAAGMEEQTKQVNLISSAVEEMSASVQEVANRANDAATKARGAGASANAGGQVVEETINDMGGIAEAVTTSAQSVGELGARGEEISQVIAVINDIADQTNLLALNAAIEAARAGEHGRGFAVVADEVRKLADRTTAATEEVADSIRQIQSETKLAVELISGSTSRVDSGVSRAREAGDSLGQIVQSTGEVANLVEDIARASVEQSTVSEEISRNITSVSTVSTEAVEEAKRSAQAVAQMSSKADELRTLINRFKITS
jgi:methyl-accepting chemotaxis protein